MKLAPTALAVALMLAGAAMIFTGPSSAIAYAFIAVGLALTIMVARPS